MHAKTNAANYDCSKVPKTKNHGVSMTVPDMSLSLRDLLNRHLAGGRIKTYHAVYSGENSIIPARFEHMDKMERQELSNQLGDFVKTTRDRIITQREAMQRSAYEKAIIEAHEAKKSSSGGRAEPDI